MPDPRVRTEDLTGKARIRNAAMDLYSQYGEDRTSMRAIAAEAGVNVGLLVHHFKNKDGIREAVEELVVAYFREAIRAVPSEGSPREVTGARDAAVERMLESHPAVVNYLRRALLDPAEPRGHLLERLTELTKDEAAKARESGTMPGHGRESTQVVSIIVRQLGRLFLQPMVDTMWDQLAGPDETEDDKPVLIVAVRDVPSTE